MVYNNICNKWYCIELKFLETNSCDKIIRYVEL